jgi:ribosomal protein S26
MCQLELWAYRVVLEPQGSVLTISTSFLTDVELKMGFCVSAAVRWGLYTVSAEQDR